MGLFRKIILVAGGLAVMPSPPDAPADAGQPSHASYLAAAVGAASDAMEFCHRRASVCETAGYAAAAFETKAKYSVKLLYEWANREEPSGFKQVDAMETGSTSASGGKKTASASTLTPDDVVPEWISPPPKKG
jgi:Family of unknown function (DUF5330)